VVGVPGGLGVGGLKMRSDKIERRLKRSEWVDACRMAGGELKEVCRDWIFSSEAEEVYGLGFAEKLREMSKEDWW